jgi:chromosome segregation ATPase
MIIAKKTLLNRRKNKMKIQNFLKLDSLKMHINSLNEELIRKNNLITELQNNKKVRGYKELQKSLIKNCDQINERLQEENIELKSRIESLFHLLKDEQNANRALKEKIRNFNHRFSLFKELSINKVKKLDQELSIAKEKERNLAIKIIGDEDKEKIENHHKNAEYNNMKQKISKYESDMKKNEEMIKKYKNENLNQREEIKKLKKEKTNLENKNKQIMEENEEMKSKIKEMNKKIIELENKIKKGDKIFFTDIEKEIKKSNLNNKKENDDKIEENNFDDNYENE